MNNVNLLKPSNRIFTKRLFIYFIISLILQSVVAYGALIIFMSLPYSLTGVYDNNVIERRAHQGTVYLISQEITNNPQLTTEQVLAKLQPNFGFRLQVQPNNISLPSITQHDINKYGIGYDEDNQMIYATLNEEQYLALGPIMDDDIFTSNILPLVIFLLLFAGFSAVMFSVLLYFMFSYLWRDAKNMSIIVDELGKGNLQVRAKPAQSWLFKQLASVINTMCNQIEKLISSNRIILHAMAHELRTPLARMNFEVEMLANEPDEQEKQRLISEITNDMKELEALINSSLNYFKIQQTQQLKNITQVPLQSWTMSIIDNLTLLKPHNFDLECEIEDKTVELDKLLVETVIKNLLLNAFKYSSNKAVLRLSQKDDLLFIIVDDNGSGVPLSDRETIFLPFSRLDSSRAKSTGGYGLGLAYVKLIAEYCQGNAFVITSPLGGARFVITLNFS